MADIGSAYLTVRPDLSGFGREVLRRLGPALRAAERETEASGQRAGIRFGRAADRALRASVRAWGRAAFANLVASAGAASVAVAGALAPASGALLAIPAAAGMASAAVATLAVGVRGVGDAMAAVAEGDAAALSAALEDLSPNARQFIRSWAGLNEAFAPVQAATQDRLFAGLADDLDSLTAGGALPVLETGLGDVADALNGLAREAVSTAATPLFQGQASDAMAGTAEAASSFQGAVAPLMSVLAELVAIGLPLVTRFGEWASGALASASAFLSSEAGAARMASVVERSVGVLAQLGRIAGNTSALLGAIFGGASGEGQSLLDTIERLTGQWAAWAQTAQGQQQIAQVFGLLVAVFESLVLAVPVVTGGLAAVSAAFASLPAPVQAVVSSSLAWSILLGPLLARMGSLAPLARVAAGGIGLLARGAASSVGAMGRMVQGMRSAQVANSAFSGTAGSIGGALRRGWDGAATATRSGTARVAAATRTGLTVATTATRNAATGLGGAVQSGWTRAATAVRTAGATALSTAASWGRLAASQTAAAAAATRARLATVATAAAQRGVAIATGLWTMAQRLLNAAMRANPIGVILTLVGLLVAGVIWAYNNIGWFRTGVQAAFQAIASVANWLWINVLQPAFTWLSNFLTGTVGPAVQRFYTAYVQPALQAVGAIVRWLWDKVGRPIFNLYVSYLRNIVGPAFVWLWRTIIRPAMQGVGSIVRTVWNDWVSPAFSALRSGIDRVADGFRTGVSAIRRWWNGLRSAARAPVKWVIDTIYTDGIKKMWDAVATRVGLDRLPSAPRLATGGIIPGYAPGRDSVLAMLSPGEAVLRPEVTRWLGADAIHGLNSAARTGRLSRTVQPPLPAFAGGGIVGRISTGVSGFLDQATDLWTDGVRAAAKAVLDPMVSGARQVLGDTEWGAMIAEVPARLVDKLLDWFERADGRLGGGPMARKAIRFARSQIGVPYSWGGGGPAGPSFGFAQGSGIKGFDCSSLMQYALTNAGVEGVPRVSQAQMTWVKKVSTPQPGDLGFPHPGHVWMATTRGGGRIIEAPRTGLNVRETSGRPAQKWGRPRYRELARGGIVTRPLHALVGEAGPEAVIPLRRGLDDLAGRIGDAIRLPERETRTLAAPQQITVHARTNADPHAIASAIQRRMTLLRNAGVVGPAAPVGGAT